MGDKDKPDPKKPKVATKHEADPSVDLMEHTMVCPVCDELGAVDIGGMWGCSDSKCKAFGKRMKPSDWNRASIMGRI